MEDNWKHRSAKMRCETCMSFVPKVQLTGEQLEMETVTAVGRCRRNAPTMKGFPVVFSSDWCGEHKIDENKI